MQSQNEPSAMKVAIEICEEFAEHWEQQARSGDNTGASDHRADAARQIIAELRNVNTAPPAQIALTDDARDAARYRWLRRRAFMLDESDDSVTTISLFKAEGPAGEFLDDQIDAALTAAQSASGDTK